jgi:anti-sigma B factor antagonist
MEIIEEALGNVYMVQLMGRLDASCASELKDKVLSMIDENKRNILIDLGGVDFIDSSGLGILVTCLRSVTKVGGLLKITSLQENPKNLFQTTRLDRVFEIFDDRNEAIKEFS